MALLIRFDDVLWESLLSMIRYIKSATGSEPDQAELAQTLGSYFIVNEIGNQLKFIKKRHAGPDMAAAVDMWRLRWRFDLAGGPPLNNLARAGLFIGPVGEAIERIRTHASQAVGLDVSDDDVARSLKSSFILSEIVNQVKWLRQCSEKAGSSGAAAAGEKSTRSGHRRPVHRETDE